jgi:NAD(P)-dependent dehydrogenase (short-subunit alcohol dehydrogenase family)
MKRWRGPVAVVADADRGIGREAAIALGGSGAFVYAIGRSFRPAIGGGAGSLDDTIEAIRSLGGEGHAVGCDCASYNALEQLFAEVAARHRRLDILVNAFAMPDVDASAGKPIWETRPQLWSEVVDLPNRAAYFAIALAAPLLIASARKRAPGLIVNLSGLDRANVACCIGASASAGLTRCTATELQPHHVAVVALQPDCDSADATAGRCIAALAIDPDRMRRTGRSFSTADLAADYRIGEVLPDRFPTHSG